MSEQGATRIGIVGMGVAGKTLVPFIEAHPDAVLTAVAIRRPAELVSLGLPPGIRAFPTVEELCESGEVDAVYIATPTPVHAAQTIAAARRGCHVVVEKPMAVSLEEAELVASAAEANGVQVVVGHSQSFEAPIRALRAIVASGDLGALTAINAWYFTDWMYRPRHPEELDPALGGTVPLRQGAHHFDIVRFIGGGLLRSVRGMTGRWDRNRPGEGAYSAYAEFDSGVPVTAVYSGYDHFPSTELTFGIGETGQQMGEGYAVARARLHSLGGVEAERAARSNAAKGSRQMDILRGGAGQPFFGLLIVSCERGDLRIGPQGLIVYGDTERREIPLAGWPVGRRAVLDELVGAVRGQFPAVHSARWGMANLEATLAVVRSAAERREIMLEHQVALPSTGPAEPALPALG